MSFKGSHSNPFPEVGQGNENPRQGMSMQIAGYQIDCQIGRGGMATVYRAMQQSLGRQVAIKILAQSPEEDDEFAQRFKKEGRILARLLHPNIITIHDVGISENNQLFLSIEYLPGGTLGDRIKQGLSFESAIQITRAIAVALGYAHERGIIHRDVKPSNIMFRQDGTPVLTDFGVARVLESKTIHTLSGLAVGSPGYMSPEQAMGENATIQSDLYSLGVVLYEMLTGRRLYEASNLIAITLKHLHDPIPDLPEQYAHLQPVLNKLLAKKNTDRYKNTDEFLHALDQAIGDGARTNPRAIDISHISIMEFTTGKIQTLIGKKLRRTVLTLIAGFIVIAIVIVYLFESRHPLDQAGSPEPIRQGQQEIETLLKLAGMQLKSGILGKEFGQDNAEATYRHILTLDPGNANALAGLENIAKEYEKLAKQRLDKGALQESLDQIKRGLAVAPENQKLLRLRQEIEDRIAEVNAQKAREEEQRQLRIQAEEFLAQARTYFQEGLLEIGLYHTQQGLLAVPDHPSLLALRDQIQVRIAEQQRREEETRRQAVEMERQKAEQARQQKEAMRRQAEIAERQKAEQARRTEEEARRRAEASQYLARALDYYRNGKYSASSQQIERGLALVPNHEDLLRLREQVRAERLAEQQRQDARRQAAKASRPQTKPAVDSPRQESDATLRKLQEIKNAVDALDKSLGK